MTFMKVSYNFTPLDGRGWPNRTLGAWFHFMCQKPQTSGGDNGIFAGFSGFSAQETTWEFSWPDTSVIEVWFSTEFLLFPFSYSRNMHINLIWLGASIVHVCA